MPGSLGTGRCTVTRSSCGAGVRLDRRRNALTMRLGRSIKRTMKAIPACLAKVLPGCFAAALFVAPGAQAQPIGVSADAIRIGQSAPLTGANAELGNDIRNGAMAYFRKVNEAGGVHGRKIELASLDDGNTVPKAEENTKKL